MLSNKWFLIESFEIELIVLSADYTRLKSDNRKTFSIVNQKNNLKPLGANDEKNFFRESVEHSFHFKLHRVIDVRRTKWRNVRGMKHK
ncbi:CLUMA_CG003573, isoform A [Clunio marinus]|uniref:CLUMA_CG003573, isoform A n=1 Tax=Clunio marinus TaxID=568069 RepID=A0A1J1HNY7_9DIPT|nr:CLUMA_CG003573, isoform A [Clunio marinus]